MGFVSPRTPTTEPKLIDRLKASTPVKSTGKEYILNVKVLGNTRTSIDGKLTYSHPSRFAAQTDYGKSQEYFLIAGTYNLEIKSEGFETFSKLINIPKNKNIEVTLVEKPGYFKEMAARKAEEEKTRKLAIEADEREESQRHASIVKPELSPDQTAFASEEPARQLAILHKMFHEEEPWNAEARFQSAIDTIVSTTTEKDPQAIADKIVKCHELATENRTYNDVTLLEIAEGLASTVVPDSGVTFDEVAASIAILIKHNRKK